MSYIRFLKLLFSGVSLRLMASYVLDDWFKSPTMPNGAHNAPGMSYRRSIPKSIFRKVNPFSILFLRASPISLPVCFPSISVSQYILMRSLNLPPSI